MADSDIEMSLEEQEDRTKPTVKKPPHIRQQISVFGAPCLFNTQKLPTQLDVLRRLFVSFNDSFVDDKQSASLKSFCGEVAEEIASIWKKTKIPIISEKCIIQKLKRLIEDYQNAIRYHKESPSFQQFMDKTKNLFEIAHCKCNKNACKCSQSTFRIPKSQIDFIFDQRGQRLKSMPLETSNETEQEPFFTTESDVYNPETGSEYLPTTGGESPFSTTSELNVTHYSTRRSLTNFAGEVDRYKVSLRAASALATALLKDLGIKESDGQPVIVDKK